jgi:ubiquinone/menaquinone biosynthesis C-methylase UbiE
MALRESLYGLYVKFEQVLVPGLQYSQSVYQDVLENYVAPDSVWLDLGCGHQILPAWHAAEERKLVARCKEVVGMDYDQHSLLNHQTISRRVRGDVSSLPFRDNYFDMVTANMVVEHLSEPSAQFREVHRILKPGGLFIFHTPNAHGYSTAMARLVPDAIKGKLIYLLDGRQEEDVFETHYKANTPHQVESLARATHFKLIELKTLVTNAMFSLILPLAVPELLVIKLLRTEPFKNFRTGIITVWQKPAQ